MMTTKSIPRAAAAPQPDPDELQAVIEGATHGPRNERNGSASAAGIGRAPRLEQVRSRVMVNLPPDVIPELDRRAAEYGYSRSMYIQRLLTKHFEDLHNEEIAEAAAREQHERDRAEAEAKRAAKRAAAKKNARARARAAK